MISDKIQKHNRSLKDRGIHEDSFFTAHFTDGSSVTEHDTNWSEFSEMKTCEFFGDRKTVYVCKHPMKKLHVKHGSLQHIIYVPEGHEVYQAIRSETDFNQNGQSRTRIVGRVVGLIKNGVVVEEHFLNGSDRTITGAKI